MEEKEVYKPYKCEICGIKYETVQERAACELRCLEKQREEEKKAAEEKKRAEKELRKAEVDKAIKHANTLLESYIEVYGSYEYEDNMLDNLFKRLKYYGWF